MENRSENKELQNKISFSRIMDELRRQKPFLAGHYGVDYIGVFGSFVHQNQSADSDLDILVTFHKVPGLLKFMEIEHYLTDLLGVKVDLVVKDGLKPRIGKRILSEVIPV